MEVGKYLPQGVLIRGRYVGPGSGLKGCTCLMADMGEWWSVQVDQHPNMLMMFGWWRCPKEDWEPASACECGGGVPGNENVVKGKFLCDYCCAELDTD